MASGSNGVGDPGQEAVSDYVIKFAKLLGVDLRGIFVEKVDILDSYPSFGRYSVTNMIFGQVETDKFAVW